MVFVLPFFSESQLTRKTPPSYSDGVYRMSGHDRPSPRTLSQAFMKGQEGMASLRNRTALSTFFGKQHLHFTYLGNFLKKINSVAKLNMFAYYNDVLLFLMYNKIASFNILQHATKSGTKFFGQVVWF